MRIYLIPSLLTGLFLFMLALGPAGCSGAKIDESDPASLFKEAEESVLSGHYQVAIDRFRTIRNKFPYSKFATDAQLRIADVYFMQESYIEAAAAYETFRDLHPKHDKAAFAMFRIGKSYFHDIPSVLSRDLTSAQKAIEAYAGFLKSFSTAPEAAEARKDLAEARHALAEKELYIADFYMKRGATGSAEARYKKIVEHFPDTPAAKTAEAKLTKLGQKKWR